MLRKSVIHTTVPLNLDQPYFGGSVAQMAQQQRIKSFQPVFRRKHPFCFIFITAKHVIKPLPFSHPMTTVMLVSTILKKNLNTAGFNICYLGGLGLV